LGSLKSNGEEGEANSIKAVPSSVLLRRFSTKSNAARNVPNWRGEHRHPPTKKRLRIG